MSLSQEPAFSNLKNYFVCGFTDITNQSYAGVSGRHERQGNAVSTSNGAGPHNIQMFMLASDGTVLQCLPGFWDPRDLSQEMKFAWQLNKVYTDRSLNKAQKDTLFKQMQLAHIDKHPPAMVRRSHMQGFDQQYEAHYKLDTSDAIIDRKLVKQCVAENEWHGAGQAFKTTDVLMHERMAKRPFLAFERFDVAAYTDYGKPRYDKNEDQIDAHSGRMIGNRHDMPTIGDQHNAERITQEHQAGTKGGGNGSASSSWGNSQSGSGQWTQGEHSGSSWGSSYSSDSHHGSSRWGETGPEKKKMK